MSSRALKPALIVMAFVSACTNAEMRNPSGSDAVDGVPAQGRHGGMHSPMGSTAPGAGSAMPAMMDMASAAAAGVTPVTMPPDPAPFDGTAAVDVDPSADVVEAYLEANLSTPSPSHAVSNAKRAEARE